MTSHPLEETSEIASVIAVKPFTHPHFFGPLRSCGLRCSRREDRCEQIGALRDALEVRVSLATVVIQRNFSEVLRIFHE